MSQQDYTLYTVCSQITQHISTILPIQQTVHDNNQAKDVCDQVMQTFEDIGQLQDGLMSIINYLQFDQPEEQKMTELEGSIFTHQQEINNSLGKLDNINFNFMNSPWLNMDNVNLMMGRGGQIKLEYLDAQNMAIDYKTKQQEKKYLLRKMLLTMKKPPKVDKIKLKDDRCVVKTELYQINYDLQYDNETESFYWKIPRTKDIQISDNCLSYLQNFLKDEKSKKDIQVALDELNKSLQQQKKLINQITKERRRRMKQFKQKIEDTEVKSEYQYQVKMESDYNNNHAKEDFKSQVNLGLMPSFEFIGEGISLQEEHRYQILVNKAEIMNQYVFCYVDQKIKSVFSDQVLEILQKEGKNKEILQKKFGSEVVYLQKSQEIKEKLKFNDVLIRFQPQAAMLQSVLRQENQLRSKGDNNKILQTTIYIEHISYDTHTYYQFILAQEKINFYRQIRAKSQLEQKEIIDRIQNYIPNQEVKEQINFKYLLIQDALKNQLLPKQSFSLTPFDSIYIKTNITLSQIDSALLKPFLHLEEENQHSVDSLFLINKLKDNLSNSERLANLSSSDNVSYLSVVIGDKIDLEIILQQYRVIMLQQFFISNYKLCQHDENSMYIERGFEQKFNNITLLIKQKREIFEEDRAEIKTNKRQNEYLTQAVIKLTSHPMIKNIVYQVLICIEATRTNSHPNLRGQGLQVEQKDDPEIYYIIIPYITDKQHYLIYNSLNSDIIELDSQKELELDELIQDLQKSESVIQNFVNTAYITQAVQKNILHSQFKAVKESPNNKTYQQMTIECRLKDELNSDKIIHINIYNNFKIQFVYYFGDLSDQKSLDFNDSGSQFLIYKEFFATLSSKIQQCLKDIYQRYYYLSDDQTRLIREILKPKILVDGWFTKHSLKIRPDTIVQQHHQPQILGQQQQSSSNQNIPHSQITPGNPNANTNSNPHGQTNGPSNPHLSAAQHQQSQQARSSHPPNSQQNNSQINAQHAQQSATNGQQNQNSHYPNNQNQQNANSQRHYGNSHVQHQGGIQPNQQGNNTNYGQQSGSTTTNQRVQTPQYSQNQQQQFGASNNYQQGQQQHNNQPGNSQNQHGPAGSNYSHMNGAQSSNYNHQQHQGSHSQNQNQRPNQ